MPLISQRLIRNCCLVLVLFSAFSKAGLNAEPFVPLFREEGEPKGWMVRHWSDVSQPGPEGAKWKVEKGILRGSSPRGTWLVSEKEYGDFILDFEFKLGPRGNSGLGLRFPKQGDPAFDGLEMQMVDPRYYPAESTVGPDELTGSVYKAAAPTVQVFKPENWNRCRVIFRGSHLKVFLNGERIQNLELTDRKEIKRHDGSSAPALVDRPRRGHLGFQELSRGDSQVEIRNVWIKNLDEE